ncbi:MAG: hypothetical protein ACK4N5_20950 [Myxococcales bacterium]
MAYELFIRTRNAATPEQAASLRAELARAADLGVQRWLLDPAPPTSEPVPATTDAAAPATAAPVPSAWSLPNQHARVQARLVQLESGVAGADLEVAVGGTESEFKDALQLALWLGEPEGFLLYDPQLARELTAKEAELAMEQWRKLRNWSVDYLGTTEDPRHLAPIAAPEPLLTRRNKVLLLAVGALFALYLLVGAVTGAVFEEPPPDESGPPPNLSIPWAADPSQPPRDLAPARAPANAPAGGLPRNLAPPPMQAGDGVPRNLAPPPSQGSDAVPRNLAPPPGAADEADLPRNLRQPSE